jgi:hypothetical protein
MTAFILSSGFLDVLTLDYWYLSNTLGLFWILLRQALGFSGLGLGGLICVGK